MTKKALLVGCNYPGTQAALNGCINDVLAIRKMLISVKGFDASNITVMIDTDKRYTQPTGRNVKAGLIKLITESQPGDILVFHFSGHGTQIPAEGFDSDEVDGKDEAICPTDLNVIVDNDLRDIVMKLPDGVDLTFITDCCHSGSMLDHAEVLISGDKRPQGPSLMDLMGGTAGRGIDLTPRNLPIELLASMLSQQSGQQVRPGNVRMSMGNIFGPDASAMVHSFTQALSAAGAGGQRGGQGGMCMAVVGVVLKMCMQRQQQQGGGGGGGFSSGLGGEPISYPTGFTPPPPGYKPPPSEQLSEDKGILITGCQSHETSADACPSGDKSKAFGALTNAITTVVDRDPNVNYVNLVKQVRGYLLQGGFSQNPCLEGSELHAGKPFICDSVVGGTLM
jgi:hypothetical protein